MPNSSALSSICAVVCRIPYEPGVPTESAKAPSRKTCVDNLIVPALRPARTAVGEAGPKSIHLRMVLSTRPVHGIADPEPNGAPRGCVTDTTVPAAHAD